MKENKFNREWVKTFAIIFLAVLLVLTFFSNTIMNMSLPEVSTEYIQYGMIKTQVRGTGTVLAQDNYSVTTSATREVVKVAVKQGDEVKKGDVLFYLSEADSDELKTARDNYDNLNYDYNKLLIDSSTDKTLDAKKLELKQTQSDLEDTKAKLENFSELESKIEAAKAELKAAERAVTKKQNEITELEKDKAAVGYTPTEDEAVTGKKTDVTLEQYTAATKQLEAAESKIDDAKAALTELTAKTNTAKTNYDKVKREYDEINGKIETPLETLEEKIKTSDREIESLERDIKYLKQDVYANKHNDDLEKAYENFKDKQKAYKAAKASYDAILEDPESTDEQRAKALARYKSAQDSMDAAYIEYDNILTNKEETSSTLEKSLAEKETNLKYALEDNTKLKKNLNETRELDKQLKAKKTELEKAENTYNTANDASSAAQTVYDNATAEKELLEKQLQKTRNGYKYIVYKDYEDKIDAANDELDRLNDVKQERNDALSDLQSDSTDTEKGLKDQIKSYERQIVTIQNDIETALKDAGNTKKLNDLELEKKRKEIARAYEQVQKLEAEYTNTEIKSPVDGIIDSVSISSGQKTTPDQSLAEISLKDNGYKMTLTVSQEQAAKLRPGSPVEITSYIPYDSEITATLSAIKNDTANKGSRQKVLEFVISGDVTPNMSLSVSVGDKNASYDNTVPNTAIREDSDGKYILIVDSKSTPISTRYIAKRVNVTVVASDDTRSAITGDFQNYSYVVATSSKPINDKDQVKLVEN